MLVFAIDLDIELTFRSVKGGDTGLSGKTRLKLVEFRDKREAKKQEKLLRKEQEAEAEEEIVEDIADPIIAKEEKIVVKQSAKNISPINPVAPASPIEAKQKAEAASTEKKSDELDPARDINVRSNGPAKTYTNGKTESHSSA